MSILLKHFTKTPVTIYDEIFHLFSYKIHSQLLRKRETFKQNLFGPLSKIVSYAIIIMSAMPRDSEQVSLLTCSKF